jgi:hypothetical protein
VGTVVILGRTTAATELRGPRFNGRLPGSASDHVHLGKGNLFAGIIRSTGMNRSSGGVTAGSDFGGILTGQGTDPGTGSLLVPVALAQWPGRGEPERTHARA